MSDEQGLKRPVYIIKDGIVGFVNLTDLTNKTFQFTISESNEPIKFSFGELPKAEFTFETSLTDDQLEAFGFRRCKLCKTKLTAMQYQVLAYFAHGTFGRKAYLCDGCAESMGSTISRG